MGEKKRRLAAAKALTPIDAALNARIAQLDSQCAQLEALFSQNPANHAALFDLAVLRLQISLIHREREASLDIQGRELNHALNAITQAIQIAPGENTYWRQFAECIKYASLELPLNPQARDLLTRALDHPAIPPSTLAAAIVSLLRSHPALKSLSASVDVNRTGGATSAHPAKAQYSVSLVAKALDEPLVHTLLECCVVADPLMETLIVVARREALAATAASGTDTTTWSTQTLAALAHQCFATEYLYDVSPSEIEQLAWLENALQERLTNAEVPIQWLLLRACYGMLNAAESAALKRISGAAPAAVARLATRMIDEPSRERMLRESIMHATPTDGTSIEVREMYEEHPYPRWFRTAAIDEGLTFAGQLQRLLPDVDLSPLPSEQPRILIAGCGTGQHSIETARRFPSARVLAIDISIASLAYAKRKTLELGIENIEYRQGDILALGDTIGRFDLIESVGVLHHLENPLAGWRALRALLKPRALMRIGLYSEIAREEITQLRDLGQSLGLAPNLAGIRQLRIQARTHLPDQGARSLAFTPDFYCTSGCRDLLFHPMEHRFTLPRIAEFIGLLNLEFLGFWLPTSAIAERYRARFNDDPLMRNLSYWDAFEQTNRRLFQGMYNFWSRARD